jgi:V/A-type H+-transporting ATPase subunit I
MIINVVKYLIIGVKEEIDKFFEMAQEQGFLEFISVSNKKHVEQPIPVQSLMGALKILRKFPAGEPYLGGGDLPFAMQISERILELKEDLEKLSEEKRLLEAEISRVAPFGDFSMEDIDYIERKGDRKIQFFCRKTTKDHTLDVESDVIYIATEYGLDYFISISKDAAVHPGMIEMRIDSPLGELNSRLQFVDDAIHRFESELKDYTGHSEFLQSVLIHEMDKYNLVCAKKDVSYPMHNSIFSIEVWIPENKIPILFNLLEGMAIYAEQIAVEKKDRIPTCMENEGTGLVGEDLVKIYDVPAITDKDPSLWVLWFFVFFFSIIIGDAGYGVIFLVLGVYLKHKHPHVKGMSQRMLKLLHLLSYGCIIWGVLTCSYFGLRISPESFLSQISPLHYLAEQKALYHFHEQDSVYEHWVGTYPQLKTITGGRELLEQASTVKDGSATYKMLEEFSGNIILEITLLIGIIHISLSFLRVLKKNIAGLGWIAFMIGGYLYFPGMLQSTSLVNFMGWLDKTLASAVGLQLIYTGLAFAIISALIQRGIKGCGEISSIIQIFVDVLSYLRLYALSLAGAIMASTFNQEGGALGLVFGALAIFLGHCINISVGFMGGIIHGLRLNFLEWYHHCFDGGGRLFKPLKKIMSSVKEN